MDSLLWIAVAAGVLLLGVGIVVGVTATIIYIASVLGRARP